MSRVFSHLNSSVIVCPSLSRNNAFLRYSRHTAHTDRCTLHIAHCTLHSAQVINHTYFTIFLWSVVDRFVCQSSIIQPTTHIRETPIPLYDWFLLTHWSTILYLSIYYTMTEQIFFPFFIITTRRWFTFITKLYEPVIIYEWMMLIITSNIKLQEWYRLFKRINLRKKIK